MVGDQRYLLEFFSQFGSDLTKELIKLIGNVFITSNSLPINIKLVYSCSFRFPIK